MRVYFIFFSIFHDCCFRKYRERGELHSGNGTLAARFQNINPKSDDAVDPILRRGI